MEGVTEGRIVHYVLYEGEHRAAIIINAHDGGFGKEQVLVNLHVFLDGSNDIAYLNNTTDRWKSPTDYNFAQQGWLWANLAQYSEANEIGTWHWIEKV